MMLSMSHEQYENPNFPVRFYSSTSAAAGQRILCHWQREYELIHICSGSMTAVLNGEQVVVHSDELVVIQPEMLHGALVEGCTYERLVVNLRRMFQDNRLCRAQLAQLETGCLPRVLRASDGTLFCCAVALFQVMQKRKPGYEMTVFGLLCQMAGVILERYPVPEPERMLGMRHVRQMKAVLRYIEAHFGESVTLEGMASPSGMNTRYFCRFFRSMTLYTPIDYLNDYRIVCACEQLEEEVCSIAEVARYCGFHDLSYFIKTFKKYQGITPKRFLSVSEQADG